MALSTFSTEEQKDNYFLFKSLIFPNQEFYIIFLKLFVLL